MSPYLTLIPNVLFDVSYVLLTVALFEFIIAQSPRSMKGILIGFYYTLRFGLAGLLNLIEYYAFNKYHPTRHYPLSCRSTHMAITIIALLSMIFFTIVAYKYKRRERDEVVNVHIFAEEYLSLIHI